MDPIGYAFPIHMEPERACRRSIRLNRATSTQLAKYRLQRCAGWNDTAVPLQHSITGIMNLAETAMLLGRISLRGNVKSHDHRHGHGNQ